MDIPQDLREYLLQKYLKGQPPEGFDDDYNLIDDGLIDSLGMLNLVNYMEKHYQIEFGDHDIVPEHFVSINAMLGFIRQKRGGTEGSATPEAA